MTTATPHLTKLELADEIKALVDQYRGRDLPYWDRDPRRYSTGYLVRRRDEMQKAVELKRMGETYKALLYFTGSTILLEGENHA